MAWLFNVLQHNKYRLAFSVNEWYLFLNGQPSSVANLIALTTGRLFMSPFPFPCCFFSAYEQELCPLWLFPCVKSYDWICMHISFLAWVCICCANNSSTALDSTGCCCLFIIHINFSAASLGKLGYPYLILPILVLIHDLRAVLIS